MTRARNTAAATFAIPAAIGAATATGLAAGLAGDGRWDAIAALGLAVPVVVAAIHLRRRAVTPPRATARDASRG